MVRVGEALQVTVTVEMGVEQDRDKAELVFPLGVPEIRVGDERLVPVLRKLSLLLDDRLDLVVHALVSLHALRLIISRHDTFDRRWARQRLRHCVEAVSKLPQ